MRAVRCYAEGRDGDWEAICLDLDISVQGRSFQEVFESLDKAINLYLQSVLAMPDDDRSRLLHRLAPLSVRLRFVILALRALFSNRDTGGYHHHFTMPLHA